MRHRETINWFKNIHKNIDCSLEMKYGEIYET